MDVNTAPTPTSRTTVVSLLIVGLLAIGLGVYQWYALYQMRMSGITPSCAISENIDCASVWNSPLADLAHHYTGLPFAGWGAAWGLDVLILAITLILRRRGARGSHDVGGRGALGRAADLQPRHRRLLPDLHPVLRRGRGGGLSHVRASDGHAGAVEQRLAAKRRLAAGGVRRIAVSRPAYPASDM